MFGTIEEMFNAVRDKTIRGFLAVVEDGKGNQVPFTVGHVDMSTALDSISEMIEKMIEKDSSKWR